MIARWVDGPNGPVVVRETSDPIPLMEGEGWDRRVYRWYGDVLGVLVLAYPSLTGESHTSICRRHQPSSGR